jgi:hypothetical protein
MTLAARLNPRGDIVISTLVERSSRLPCWLYFEFFSRDGRGIAVAYAAKPRLLFAHEPVEALIPQLLISADRRRCRSWQNRYDCIATLWIQAPYAAVALVLREE